MKRGIQARIVLAFAIVFLLLVFSLNVTSQIATDKQTYTLGENVTITLNANAQSEFFIGYGNENYQYFGNFQQPIVYTPQSAGLYQLTLTNGNNTYTETFTVQEAQTITVLEQEEYVLGDIVFFTFQNTPNNLQITHQGQTFHFFGANQQHYNFTPPNVGSYVLSYELNGQSHSETFNVVQTTVAPTPNTLTQTPSANTFSDEFIQGNASIDQTVVWTRLAQIGSGEEIDIPKKHSKLAIMKEESGNYVAFSNYGMNENLSQAPSGDNETITINEAGNYHISYETQAPTVEESMLTPRKKQVLVSSDVHYTNVAAYTNVPEIIEDEDNIKIYWKEEDSYLPFKALDINDNGYIDRLEWMIPHLSNQTFEIILITDAQHLDENKTFIEDIFAEVGTLDNIWKEIPQNHYVRVTFEENLSSDKDITIYARSNYTGARVEVYEKGGNITLATFENVFANQSYQILLHNLTGEQDTFDLLILDAPIEFDYIVDPIIEVDNDASYDVSLTAIDERTFVVGFVDAPENDVSFRVYDTNGTALTGITDVDTSVDAESRVSVSGINATNFVIGWIDGPANDVTYSIFYTNGTIQSGPTDAEGNVGGPANDVSVVQMDDRFQLCYVDDAEGDADVRTILYSTLGSGSEGALDGGMGPDATLHNIFECASVNTTRYVGFWHDDGGANDASYEVRDQDRGDLGINNQDIDGDVGDNAQVAVATVNQDRFGLLWYDSDGGDLDIEFAIRDVDNGVIISPTTVDTNAGATPRVALATIRNSSEGMEGFLLAWNDRNAGDIRAAVYNATGNITAGPYQLVDDENATSLLFDVYGRDSVSGHSLCNDTFALAYTNTSGSIVARTFNIDGTDWDGVCNHLPTHSIPILNSTLGTNFTTENLTVYNQSTTDPNDEDQVKNIYDWRLENFSIATVNMPFEGGGSDNNTAKDYSIFSNNGTVLGASFKADAGFDGGGAYEFENASSAIINVSVDLNQWLGSTASLTYWIRTVQVGHNTVWLAPGVTGIESAGDGDDIFWGWLNASGSIGLQVGNTGSIQSSGPVNDDVWHHIAMVRNHTTGSTLLYVDGVLEGNATLEAGTVKTNSFYGIGVIEDTGGTPTYFNGSVDEFVLYNRTLTTEQVLAIYNNRTDRITSSETVVTETWEACVTPNDRRVDGITRCSETLKIVSGELGIQINTPANNSALSDVTPLLNITVTGTVNNLEYSVNGGVDNNTICEACSLGEHSTFIHVPEGTQTIFVYGNNTILSNSNSTNVSVNMNFNYTDDFDDNSSINFERAYNITWGVGNVSFVGPTPEYLANETFDDSTSFSNWTLIGSGWIHEAGALHQTTNNDNELAIYNFTNLTAELDYNITAQITNADDDNVGIAFLFQDSSNYYRCRFREQVGDHDLELVVGGSVTSLDAGSTSYTQGATNNYGVTIEGDNITCYMNDVAVMTANNATFTTGLAGFYVAFQDEDHLDNFTVKTIPPVVTHGNYTILSVNTTESITQILNVSWTEDNTDANHNITIRVSANNEGSYSTATNGQGIFDIVEGSTLHYQALFNGLVPGTIFSLMDINISWSNATVEPPVLNIQDLTNGSTITDVTPTFNVSIDRTSELVWYTTDGGVTNYTLCSSCSGAQYTFGHLPEGSHTVIFYANDSANRLGSNSTGFTIETNFSYFDDFNDNSSINIYNAVNWQHGNISFGGAESDYSEVGFTGNSSEIYQTDASGAPHEFLMVGAFTASAAWDFDPCSPDVQPPLIECNGVNITVGNFTQNDSCLDQNWTEQTNAGVWPFDWDLDDDYFVGDPGTTFGFGIIYVWSETNDTDVRIRYDKDDTMFLYVNSIEQTLSDATTCEGITADENSVDINLSVGWNKITWGIAEDGGGYGFYWRFADTSNNVKGFNYTTSQPVRGGAGTTTNFTAFSINTTETVTQIVNITWDQEPSTNDQDRNVTVEVSANNGASFFTASRSQPMTDLTSGNTLIYRVLFESEVSTLTTLLNMNITWSNATVEPPHITIIEPINNTTFADVTPLLNVSIDRVSQEIWYSLDAGLSNFTLCNMCSSSSRFIHLEEGSTTIYVYANDTSNRIGSNSSNVTVDMNFNYYDSFVNNSSLDIINDVVWGVGNVSLSVNASETRHNETFDTAASLNNWTLIGAGWAFSSSELTMTNNDATQLAIYNFTNLTAEDDYNISSNIYNEDNDHVGIVFLYQDSSNYYRCRFRQQNGDHDLELVVGGSVTSLDAGSTSYVLDAYNNFSATIIDDNITCYMNGVPVMSAVNATFTTGLTGVYVSSQTGERFDNHSVRTLVTPEFRHGNFTAFSINTTDTVTQILNITWNEDNTDSDNTISVFVSADNGASFSNASNGQGIFDIISGDSIVYRVLFDGATHQQTFSLLDMNITWSNASIAPPQLNVTLPTNGSTIADVTPTLNVSIDRTSDQVWYTADGGITNTTVCFNCDGVQYTFGHLPVGTHTVIFYANDTSNRVGSNSTGFTIDMNFNYYDTFNDNSSFDIIHNVSWQHGNITFVVNASEQIMNETFDDSSSLNNWTLIGGGWIHEAGALHQTGNNADLLAIYNFTNLTTSLDYNISADITNADNDDVGLAFLYQDTSNYYRCRFNLQSTNTDLQRVQGGSVTDLDSSTTAYTQGATNTYGVTIQGSNITCYLNNVPVLSASDNTFTTGLVGFYDSFQDEDHFDNMTVDTLLDEVTQGNYTVLSANVTETITQLVNITWDVDNTDANHTLTIQVSANNGQSYSNASNGQALVDLSEGSALIYRALFEGTTNNHLITLRDINITWSNASIEPPQISISNPSNGTTIADVTPLLNVSLSRAVDTLWYTLNSGITNTTICNVCNATQQTFPHLPENTYTITVYGNDSSNRVGSNLTTFTVDMNFNYYEDFNDSSSININNSLLYQFDNVTFTSNFSEMLANETFENSDNWTLSGGTWVITVSDRLQQTANNGGNTAIHDNINLTTSQNYNISMIAFDADNDDTGLIFLWQDSSNYYRCRFNQQSSNTDLELISGGSTSSLAASTASYDLSSFNNYSVSIVGNNITCYLNDEPVLSAVDSTFTTGQVGIYNSFHQNTEYDDFVVTTIVDTTNHGNFTSFSINTTETITRITNITWIEHDTNTGNNITIEVSADNGQSYSLAGNGQSIDSIAEGNALVYRVLFNTDTSTTLTLSEVNISWSNGSVPPPILTVHAPITGSTLADVTPTLNVSLSREVEELWYTPDGGLTNITICNNCENTQYTFGHLPEGSQTVTFYANDTSNRIGSNTTNFDINMNFNFYDTFNDNSSLNDINDLSWGTGYVSFAPLVREYVTNETFPNSASLNNWTLVGAGWTHENGALHQDNNDATQLAIYNFTNLSSGVRYNISADITTNDNDHVGVAFKIINATNYYRCRFRQQNGDHDLERVQDGAVTSLDAGSTSYTTGATNTFGVTIEADNITCYMNDVPVMSASDTTFQSGMVGFYASSQNQDYFDNLTVQVMLDNEVTQGNFTIFSVNTTLAIPRILNITWTENQTNANNNITVRLSANNGLNYYNATSGQELDGIEPGTALLLNVLFRGDTHLRNISLLDINVTWASQAVIIVYPENTSYNVSVTELNYTLSNEFGFSSCHYSLNGGISNTSITCGSNVTGLTPNQGSNNWSVYASNSTQELSDSVIFSVDTVAPNVTLNGPADGTTFTTRTVTFNWTAIDNVATTLYCNLTIDSNNEQENIASLNGTATAFTLNGIASGTHFWNVSCVDTLGNLNTSETRNFTIDVQTEILQILKGQGSTSGGNTNITLSPALSNRSKAFHFVSYGHPSQVHDDSFKSSEIINETTLAIYGGTEVVNYSYVIFEFTSDSPIFVQRNTLNLTANPTIPVETTLSSIVNTSTAFILQHGHAHYGSDSAVGLEEYDRIRLLNETTWEYNVGDNPDTGPQENRIEVIDWDDPTFVRSVQRGTTTLGVAATSTTITPSTAVVADQTLLFVSMMISGNGAFNEPPSEVGVFATLNGSGSIIINRQSAGPELSLAWQLVEFQNGTVSVAHTNISFSDGLLNNTTTIEAVVLNRSAAFGTVSVPFGYSGGESGSTTNNAIDRAMFAINLTNTTVVEATRGDDTGIATVGIQIWEFLGAPTISNVNATNITSTTAIIVWDTDTSANSTVHYGTNLTLGTYENNNSFVFSHSLQLNDLTQNTTYFYNVTSCNNFGCTTSGYFNFTTGLVGGDPTAPFVNIISPANNTFQNFTGVVLFYNVTDVNLNLANSTLIINGARNISNQTNLSNGEINNFTLTLPEGQYNWSVNATDTGNLEGNDNDSFAITIDLQAPQITLLNPYPNESFNVMDINFSLIATDNFDSSMVCDLIIDSTVFEDDFAAANGSSINITESIALGTHFWNVTCVDEAGNYNTSETRNFTVQDFPPNVTLVTANGTVTSSSEIILEYNATDNNDLSISYLILNQVVNQTNSTEIDNGLISTFNVSGLAEGIYNWTVNVTDTAGFNATAPPRVFIVDQTPPNISQHTPLNASQSNTSDVVFNFTVFDNFDSSLTCNLTLTEQPIDGPFEATNGVATTRTINNIPDGVVYWNLTCYDHASLINSSETWFVNITERPVILLNLTNNSFFNDPNIMLPYIPQDNTNFTNCSVFIDGVFNQTNATAVSNNIQNEFDINFDSGIYDWNVTCVDLAGLVNTSEFRRFTVDLVPPNIELLTPDDGSNLFVSTVEFNFSVTDNIDTNLTCNLTVNSVNETQNFDALNGTNTTQAVFFATGGLKLWNVTCHDDAGNFNTSLTRNFTLSFAPQVSLSNPANNSFINTSTVALIYDVSDDNDNIANATLILNGGRNISNQTSITNGAENNFTVTLEDGYYNWTVNVSDLTNLEGTDTNIRTFLIDTGAPNITLNTPPNNSLETWNNITFNFTVTDNFDTSLSCKIYLNDTLHIDHINATAGVDNIFYSVHPDGFFEWNVTCEDDANNTGISHTFNFSIEAPPNVTLVTPIDNFASNMSDVTFVYLPQDPIGIENCSLYFNDQLNSTNTEVDNNQNNNFEIQNIPDGTYNWTVGCFDASPDFNEFRAIARNLTIDTRRPSIILNAPGNDTNQTDDVVFNFTAIDNVDLNLTCNLTLDGVVNASNIGAINGTQTLVSVNNIAVGTHLWNVTCWDDALNTNVSEMRQFTITLLDLKVNRTDITFNVTDPEEDENVLITANISNLGSQGADDVIVQFYENDPDSGGTQIGANQSVNFSGFESVLITQNWSAILGDTTVFVLVDPPIATNGSFSEGNESNNEANRTITVGAWHFLYGNITQADLLIDDNVTITVFQWNVSAQTGTNIFVADSESSISFTDLRGLGKTTGGANATDDFVHADSLLNISNFTDSIETLYSVGGVARNTTNLRIFKTLVTDIPIYQSITDTNFSTGILWDSSDDGGDGQFDLTDQEDLVVMTTVNMSTSGSFGVADYEIRVPATLREYTGTEDFGVSFYLEIK